ncbi:MAG: hemerythrin domain-containing protein [Solirubrobacteraceae bacterium]
MKRSPALASLSRDHHQALVVAQALRRADAAGAPAARERFLAFWPDGRRHFRDEEEVLFPAYAHHGDAHHPLLVRALGDHVAIRARADAVAADPAAPPELLHDLGERLAAHVRLEERELFVLFEAEMPPDRLTAVAEALERD